MKKQGIKMKNTFLVEIGTEELPPKSLKTLALSFTQELTAQLDQAHLEHGAVKWFATPRRLAVQIFDLANQQPDIEINKRGPALSAAFDSNGEPTQSALGWAKGLNITIEQAEKLETDKGAWLNYTAEQKGKTVQELLPKMIEQALAKLPIPKMMRWSNKTVQFIRPVHTVTLLYGNEIVPCRLFDINSDRLILGHRFMSDPKLSLKEANDYEAVLEQQGKVIADYDKRKQLIELQAKKAAEQLNGKADLMPELLEEVTSLVEWPVVLTANFEPRFLKVPSEALVYTMKGDQKYFPVYDKNGALLPHFIFVSNIESKDPKVVIAGNEKVVRPRLADAEFFYQTDCQTPLASRLPLLETVLFQQQLGTVKEKALRLEALSGHITKQLHGDVDAAKRAGLLAKCDLVTNTVFEFPETQGIIGAYLALHDGESQEIATAIESQYQPKFAGDELPHEIVAASVAIAEKIDTLAGIFGIGQVPKGDKDPFALRRAAIGILRIIIENQFDLDLLDLAQFSCDLYGDKLTNKKAIQEIIQFMQGRFKAWYQEQGFTAEEIQSVLALNPTKPTDFDKRLKAVAYFKTLPEASSLAAANKRVANILSKCDFAIPDAIDQNILKEPSEIELSQKLTTLETVLAPYFKEENYQQILIELAQLKTPVDHFFENVMVMVNDEQIKLNRLAILKRLQSLFLKVADISLLRI